MINNIALPEDIKNLSLPELSVLSDDVSNLIKTVVKDVGGNVGTSGLLVGVSMLNE